jgi:hypothetical protein
LGHRPRDPRIIDPAGSVQLRQHPDEFFSHDLGDARSPLRRMIGHSHVDEDRSRKHLRRDLFLQLLRGHRQIQPFDDLAGQGLALR